MNEDEKRTVIEKYINSYNAFDVEIMISVIHPEVEFKNISGGDINATASGINEFRKLAEESIQLFTCRKQTITKFKAKKECATIEMDYEAVLAADLPNGVKAGETLRLKGRSEFTFRDGKIYRITDIS